MRGAGRDGTLAPWDDIERLHRWNALFLGNGLSINVWPEFGYRSLFEQAKHLSMHFYDAATHPLGSSALTAVVEDESHAA